MKNNPLISVVIPTYNRQNTISYCLESVLAQTYRNLEVIIVDDRSTDSTVSIVNGNPDPRVRCVVLEKHAGAQGARNRGIQEAKADWIAFHDSDDEWMPNKLERQVSVLAGTGYNPWSFVYSNGYRFDKTRCKKDIILLPVVEGENQYASLLQSPAPLYPTIITSKKALEKIGFLDEKVPSFQEWDTSIRLAKFCSVFHVREPLMVYHVGNGDAISGNGEKHVQGWQYIINKYESDIKQVCGNDTWLKLNIQLLRRCLNLGLTEYYDRFRSTVGVSEKNNLQLIYLGFCRSHRIRPDNIVFRLTHKILPIPRF